LLLALSAVSVLLLRRFSRLVLRDIISLRWLTTVHLVVLLFRIGLIRVHFIVLH